MRNRNELPAWAMRLRTRRLARHGRERVVRWIPALKSKTGTVPRKDAAPDVSSNDNIGMLAARTAS